QRCLNRIPFDLRLVKPSPDEPNAPDYFALDIRVDERDFLEYVRDTERPFAIAEGHPDRAGKYESPPAEMALSDLGGEQQEKISLYDCECGCFGCWTMRVRISKSDQVIVRSDFEQPHRGRKSRASWWHHDRLGPFEFDREQYVEELAQVESDQRGRRRTAGPRS